MARVAGPAPSLARFRPNSINRSRLSAGSFTPTQFGFERRHHGSLGPARGLSSLVHIVVVEVDQVAPVKLITYRTSPLERARSKRFFKRCFCGPLNGCTHLNVMDIK